MTHIQEEGLLILVTQVHVLLSSAAQDAHQVSLSLNVKYLSTNSAWLQARLTMRMTQIQVTFAAHALEVHIAFNLEQFTFSLILLH